MQIVHVYMSIYISSRIVEYIAWICESYLDPLSHSAVGYVYKIIHIENVLSTYQKMIFIFKEEHMINTHMYLVHDIFSLIKNLGKILKSAKIVSCGHDVPST